MKQLRKLFASVTVLGLVAASLLAEVPLEVRVVEKQTGKPLAEADVELEGEKLQKSAKTDAQGSARFTLPDAPPSSLSARAHKSGFVPIRVDWQTRGGTFRIPQQFTFSLEPATSIGGVIQNEQGQPIANASVFVTIRETRISGGAEDLHMDIWDYRCMSDEQGRWVFDQAPKEIKTIYLRLEHPAFISDEYVRSEERLPPIEKLRDRSALMVMKKGLFVVGRVLDEKGQPIKGAKVMQGSDRWGSHFPDTETGSEGRFHFENAVPGEMILTIQAEGYSPELKTVTVTHDLDPLEFRLAKGHVLKGHVVDKAGKPLAEVNVIADTWRGHRSLDWRTKTDAEGNFEWKSAPSEQVSFGIFKAGYMSNDGKILIPSEQGQMVTLLPALRIRGLVEDADSNKPIAKFKVIPGMSWEQQERINWNDYGAMMSSDGQFDFVFSEERHGHFLRVEADGYLPAVSRSFKSDEGEQVFHFNLKKGSGLTGIVRLSDGAAAVGADVIVVSMSHPLMYWDGKLRHYERRDAIVATTGADGKFSLPPESEKFMLVALHERGFAEILSEKISAPAEVKLQPWGRVEGTLLVGTKPAARKKISLFRDFQDGDSSQPSIQDYNDEVLTDENGHFVFERVRPGELFLQPSAIPVEIKSGETTRVTLGGVGRPVIGRVVLPKSDTREVDMSFGFSSLATNLPDPWDLIPKEIMERGDAQALQRWSRDWKKSEQGKAYRKAERHYWIEVKRDGSFRLEDIPSGSYKLQITVSEPFDRNNIASMSDAKQIGEVSRVVVVPEMPGGRSDEPLDLGNVELKK